MTETQSEVQALRQTLDAAAGDKGYLDAVLYQAVDAIISVSPAGTIRSFNRAAEKMFGYSAAELIGKNVSILMPEPYAAAHDGYLQHFHTTGEARVIGWGGRELPGRRADGTIFPMELGINEVKPPGDHFFVGSVRDISQHKMAEASLLAANARAQQVIDLVPTGILGINETGTITLANATVSRLFGYTAAELVGQPVEILLPRDLATKRSEHRAAFFLDPQQRPGGSGRDSIAVRKNGSEFPAEIRLTPISTCGESWVLCSIVDITVRKAAEQSLRDNALRLTAVMNTVVDGLITVDEQGTIQSFNPGAERIFGYTEAEASGQNVKLLMPEPGHTAPDGPLHNYKEMGVNSIIGVGREVSARRKDGSAFPMDLAVGEMILHDRRLYVGILRDITARKEVENERLALIANLKQSNQDLDDFAYIASHDLREPLRGIFNNAQFFKEDYQGLVDEAGVRRLDRLGFLCKRMDSLIDDLLYFSRLGRQELAYRKTDLNCVMHDILEQSEIPPEVTIRLNEKLPTVVCDPARVGEVFRNLIANAIKYNDKAAKVVEIGSVGRDDNGRPVIYIRDNGIGIAREFHSDAFTLFKRLHPEHDHLRGTGVGLTFAKKIVERHGGRIWLDSTPGDGTTLFFALPEEQKHD
jgi:two-component system sensor kinase FixL